MDHCERFCEKQISEVMFAQFLFSGKTCEVIVRVLQQGRHSASASHRTSFEKQGMDQCERFCEKQMSEVMFAQFLFSGNRTCEVIVRVPTFLVSAVEFYTWTPGAESFVYRG